MVYNRGQISARSAGFRKFRIEQSRVQPSRIEQPKNSTGKTNFIVSSEYGYSNMHIVGALADKAFVMENLSAGGMNCRETNVSDVEIRTCTNNIKLRLMNSDDK